MDGAVRGLQIPGRIAKLKERFPNGSIELDHALVMRDILHEWHKAEDIYAIPRAV